MKKPSKTHCIHENISLMRDPTKYFYPIHPYIYIYISIVGVVYINREIPIPMDCHFFLIVYGHHQFPISIRHIFLGDQNPNFRPTSTIIHLMAPCKECVAWGRKAPRSWRSFPSLGGARCKGAGRFPPGSATESWGQETSGTLRCHQTWQAEKRFFVFFLISFSK